MKTKKIKSWVPVSAQWLAKHRVELLRQGFEEQELRILEWRDVDGMSWSEIARCIDRSPTRPQQIYNRVRRRLSHPTRAKIVPPRYRVNPRPLTFR